MDKWWFSLSVNLRQWTLSKTIRPPGNENQWKQLASSGNLAAFKHTGFWQAMDTLRDKNYLEELWKSGKAPWKRW